MPLLEVDDVVHYLVLILSVTFASEVAERKKC